MQNTSQISSSVNTSSVSAPSAGTSIVNSPSTDSGVSNVSSSSATADTSIESNSPAVASFANATGKIDYKLTNDYMFRAMLQKNEHVLTALICALLHLQPEDIKTLEILNPIELGAYIDNKDFFLDIKICFNDNTLVNLEMQVENQHNWEDRSLSYLCRTFDNLNTGQDYSEVKPAIHIGFLDFDLFSDFPEFYSTYKLRNVKNGHIFSDKFVLGVVNLTQIDLATDEDKLYQIDYWAKLFKAQTWEELKMIAEKNDTLREASESLYTLNADRLIRQQCQAREDYYKWQHIKEHKIETLTLENTTLASENTALTSKVDELTTEKNDLLSENSNLTSENSNLLSENNNLTSEIENLKKMLAELAEASK